MNPRRGSLHEVTPLNIPSSTFSSSPPQPSPKIPPRSSLRPRPRALSSATPQLFLDTEMGSFMRTSLFTKDLHLDTDVAPLPVKPKVIPKRNHALLELLSSERAFASDLSLIRDIHIPLALGGPAPFNVVPPPLSPPLSASGSSSRTVSTASDSSTTSSQLGPPMNSQDVKIIFNNIADLAMFANEFCERIEGALGDVLEGGAGQDTVGTLFLEVAPTLEHLFKTYCTRHEASIEHLESLPQTPALLSFLEQTKALAASFSHSWNLNSLLIKPVQRLLKYSLLLGAIISATPDNHPDMANLEQAKAKMEEISRGVNDQARRHAVVKEVLTAKKGELPKKKGITVGVAASVSMSRMKSARNVGKVKEGSEELDVVESMEKEIRRVHAFLEQLAKDAVAWGQTCETLTEKLRLWGLSFGQMMGLQPGDQQADAFDAFIDLLQSAHDPLCKMAIATIEDILLIEFAQLIKSTESPFRLIAAMNTLQPLHYGLLNMNFTAKNRPPPALLEASQSYLALRSQLATELPQYLVLLNKGILCAIQHLGHIQAAFAEHSHRIWSDIWNRLRREDEGAPAGADETISIFLSKIVDATADIQKLVCTNSRKVYVDKPKVPVHSKNVKTMIGSLDPPLPVSPTSTSASGSLMRKLSALDPGRAPPPPWAPPTISPSSSYTSKVSTWQIHPHKPSTESLKSRSSGQSRIDDFGEFYAEDVPLPISPPRTAPLPPTSRTKSMPIPSVPMPLRASTSTASSRDTAPPSYHEREERGREHIHERMERRDTSPQHRSPAASIRTVNPKPSKKKSFSPETMQASWKGVQSKYECRAVSSFYPPRGSTYHNLPVLDLDLDCVVSVLKELGHPSLHLNLPFQVDDGEDCLLLIRNQEGTCGFALASFLMPTDY